MTSKRVRMEGARALRAWAAGMVAMAGLVVPAGSHAAAWRTGPPPAWVVPVNDPPPAAAPVGTTPGGLREWLVDRQDRVARGTRSSFHHVIVEALTQPAVGEVANVRISFDPSYQQVTLHDLRVWRDGKPQSRLAQARIDALQRERDLESRIYDGRLTINAILPDVRPGDAVEASYTIEGSNPVFAGRQFDAMDMQWSVPVVHLKRRLLLPASARPQVRAFNLAPAPAERATADGRELTWESRDVPALSVDERTPGWYAPYRRVEWSDFADWGDVARWAAPLYAVPTLLGPALQAERDRIAATAATPVERTLAVLRLVQGQVRYLGIEMGASSHAPAAPDVVFARRFGDCKEKSLLAVTLLRSLGIEANAALVDTNRRQAIAESLPSPGAFDHVIVRARLGATDYWLDATRAPQAGDLAHLVEADFGRALVVDAATQDLVEIPAAGPLTRRRDIQVLLDLGAGTPAARPLRVMTVLYGAAAENLRLDLADSGREAYQKSAVNFYAEDFPDLRVAAPLEVTDDAVQNRVTVIEHYTTSLSDDASSIHASDLYPSLRRPHEVVRQAPLALEPPERVNLEVEVRRPGGGVTGSHGDVRVEDPAFTLSFGTFSTDRTVHATWRLERTARTVAADRMASYVQHLDEARALARLSLHPSRGGVKSALGSPTRLVLAFLVGLLTWALLGLGWVRWMALSAAQPPADLPEGADWQGARRRVRRVIVVYVVCGLVFLGAECLELSGAQGPAEIFVEIVCLFFMAVTCRGIHGNTVPALDLLAVRPRSRPVSRLGARISFGIWLAIGGVLLVPLPPDLRWFVAPFAAIPAAWMVWLQVRMAHARVDTLWVGPGWRIATQAPSEVPKVPGLGPGTAIP